MAVSSSSIISNTLSWALGYRRREILCSGCSIISVSRYRAIMIETRAISRGLVGAIEATGSSGVSNSRAVHIERVAITLRRLLLNNAVQDHKMIARNRRLGTMARPSPRVEARAILVMPSRLAGSAWRQLCSLGTSVSACWRYVVLWAWISSQYIVSFEHSTIVTLRESFR